LAERVQRVRQLPQRLVVVFLLGARRPRLEVHFVPQGGELGQERVQVGRLIRTRSAELGTRNGIGLLRSALRAPRSELGQPAADLGETGADGVGGRGWGYNSRSAFSDIRRRGPRHAISSIKASIVSRLPASNSR